MKKTNAKKTSDLALQIDYRPLDSLIPYARNARTHSDEQIARIAGSIKEFGFTNAVLLDGANGIIAGHGRVLAARKLGMDAVPCVELAYLTEAQRRAYVLADNKLAIDAGWDEEMLRLELADLKDLGMESATGFSDDEIAALFGGGQGTVGLTDEDAVPPAPKSAITVLGDLWVLGRHRLLCGDSTSVDDVGRLMKGERAVLFATDPPYLVDYTGNDRPGGGGRDWSADYVEQATWDESAKGKQFYLDFYKTAIAVAVQENAAWYCWHASKRQVMLEEVWNDCGAFQHQQIIWAKSRPVLSYSTYLWAHEPCLMGWVKGKKPKVNKTGLKEFPRTVWDMDKLEQFPLTIWEIKNKEIDCQDHPTSKPVRVFTIPMELHTDPGDLCYEPFSGSGSQLIAAEKTGRRCYGLEMSPIYCDVIVRRWEEFTGQKAVLESDGRTFADVAAGRTK